jgi:hypothetical protein
MRVSRIRPGRGRRYRAAAVIAVAVLTLAAVLVAALLVARHTGATTHSAAPPDPATVVVTVNGTGVPVGELQHFLGQERAATFAYFLQHYHADDHPGFWTTRYGGQTPTDHLKKLALDDALKATVQRNLARTHGLLTDPGYPAFLTDLRTENTRRAAALAAHQPVYGPEKYSEDDYFTYQMNQIRIRLQDILVEARTIAPTGAALRQYYDTHRATYSQPFNQVKDEVTQDFESARYDQVVSRAVGAAKVQINAAVLASVTAG